MTLLRTLLQDLPVRYTLLLCIAIAAVLVYLPFLLVAYGRLQAGYDMAKPRAVFDKLPDYAKRATWAHQNSFESFMLFAAAALMAVVTQVNSVWATAAAIGYIAARFLFSLFYILNIPILRSLMFGVGTLAIGTLMVQSLQQAAP
ncbi:MAPEG family protein [Leptolyngbya ohadii]|uniref:MAPEG family protein n=1 Tax=Leptolyngbya ohadii TaxID=1962290 RepID=UPI0015C638B0|nr:MAPEG family protein [Leptolyngbya ohadii]